MIDSVRGTLRVRKWPKKRGPPKSAKQAWWVDWFVQANRLAKYADGASMARSIAMTKGSGLYPRDVLLMAMRGRLYNWVDSDGWRWYSMAAIGDISNSLDVLGQTVGDILVRAVDRWRPPAPGGAGQVLTNQGPGAPPIWSAPPGGMVQTVLAGTPIAVDDTVSEYILDVALQFSLELVLDAIVFASSDRAGLRFSTDGGVSYHAAASDYNQIFLASSSSGTSDLDKIFTGSAPSAAAQNVRIALPNLQAGRSSYDLLAGIAGGLTIHRAGFAHFDNAVTHIKVFAIGGANFKTGTIRAVGLKAS